MLSTLSFGTKHLSNDGKDNVQKFFPGSLKKIQAKLLVERLPQFMEFYFIF